MECWRTGVQIPPAPPNTQIKNPIRNDRVFYLTSLKKRDENIEYNALVINIVFKKVVNTKVQSFFHL